MRRRICTGTYCRSPSRNLSAECGSYRISKREWRNDNDGDSGWGASMNEYENADNTRVTQFLTDYLPIGLVTDVALIVKNAQYR